MAADKIPWEREDIVIPIKAFIEKHPVLAYYALVFAISWGGILMLVAPGGIPGEPEDVARLFPSRSRRSSLVRASPASS